ncbi:MAG: valine--tRNA ligase [Gammaproteobacteria bacterium]|nr:valine--tRNA ligase [Gammaproteobacteria bacterium]
MKKIYDPQAIEDRWYRFWEEKHYFAPDGNGHPYCIQIPPPNVTGTLHMGHAFQHTLMDALIRYRRMVGDYTLWQTGTDHAGIATQMVVERQVNGEGSSRLDLGREAFVDRVWQWKEHSGGTITRQMRRLGDSPDWSRERFTMDEGLSKAVQEVFVQLYEEGLIYRGKRLVNWDPVLHTAISDLEVVSSEEDGHMWHIRYPFSEGGGFVTVATTRPETMLGDTAVAVHPDDKRYKKLIGKTVCLPLADRDIPVIADDYVDPEFGSGCVKITPAHDFNDYEIGLRHQLEIINILTNDAKLNENTPAAYRGLDRYKAREQIVKDLEAEGLLEKIEAHKLTVPRGDRSHTVLEPYLTDQWYVKTKPLAKPAIAAVKDGRIRFVPENWTKTYFNWMNDIQDWCISRQLWWGHRIPCWYDQVGNAYVARNELEAREKYQLDDEVQLHQDEDVLDTWFSSALWPFSTLGWPGKTNALKTFYPSNVLVTGFDIIFYWVARMIMMGLKFMDDVPFREVYFTGLIRDEHGHKMSKSKGNVLDPLDLMDGIDLETLVAKRTKGLMQPELAPRIEKNTRKQFPQGMPGYGADALRFTMASLATTGRDIRFDVHRMEGYRNFCNKLWNACRYVLMNTEEQDTGLDASKKIELSIADRWIASKLQKLVSSVTDHMDKYRFDLAALDLYEFTWSEYCDWYLELSKPVLQSEHASAAAKRGTRRTLVQVLEALLRIAHPFIPFITEELWQQIAPLAGKKGDSIMVQSYPQANADLIDSDAELEIEWLKTFVIGVRRIRSEMDVPPSKHIPVLLQGGSVSDLAFSKKNIDFLKSLARLEPVTQISDDVKPPEATAALVGDMKILIPLAGLIDKEEELVRLKKDIERLQADCQRLQQKLGNKSFVEKAPAEVVQQQQQRLQENQNALEKLSQQFEKIKSL